MSQILIVPSRDYGVLNIVISDISADDIDAAIEKLKPVLAEIGDVQND